MPQLGDLGLLISIRYLLHNVTELKRNVTVLYCSIYLFCVQLRTNDLHFFIASRESGTGHRCQELAIVANSLISL
jgi:hypothetical protein